MSEILCAQPLVRGTEFILDDQGARLFGTCGQRALASSSSSVLNKNVSTLSIYDSMRQHGWADPGGATTIGDLRNQAQLMNIPIASFVQYNEPWSGWQSWLTAQIAAGNPCVIEVAYGQALWDSVSRLGENAVGLRYHFIGVLGMNAPQFLPGFWCADGDSFAGGNNNANGFNAANVLQYYTDAVLAAAKPCGGLALVGRKTKMAWTKQADSSGKDDQGHTCGNGLMGELEATGEAGVDGLMSETRLPDGSTFLPLANGNVLTDVHGAHAQNQGAQVVAKLWHLYEAAPTPPAVPISTTLTPSQELDIAAMTAIKAALAAN